MNIQRFFSVFKTAGRGLALERKKLSIASENIANANTTRGLNGVGPYKPRRVNASLNGPQAFGMNLQNAKLKMRTTNPLHRSVPSAELGGGSSRDLGPQATVVKQNKFRYKYEPDNPDADANGMVKYPDVNMVKEMTHMVSANRLYEANLSSIEAEKAMIKRSFRI
ncbi:MAG TPA: flagellar basal body rod C-terminal domain-containing protein [Balneolaceae bacterium]|nr:flagellar basal body rod C-terminal domain-containing protein [Balneolaceae bacterium]